MKALIEVIVPEVDVRVFGRGEDAEEVEEVERLRFDVKAANEAESFAGALCEDWRDLELPLAGTSPRPGEVGVEAELLVGLRQTISCLD